MLRWLAILAILVSTSLAGTVADPNARLHELYGTRAGYVEVTRDVLKWHKTRANACVAFASTALRHAGVAIPMDVLIDGRNVSRITGAFSTYLTDELKWTRTSDMGELRPGDLAFSTDAPGCPGYPNHVVMFDGWVNRDKAIARVVDNNGFHIARPMIHVDGSDIDGFAYALRAPR